MNENTQVKSGIGGWLILPAIGLTLVPLISVVHLIRIVARGLQIVWVGQLFDLLGKLALFVFVCFVAYSFFKKKRAAPNNIIYYMITAVIFGAIRFVWALAFGVPDLGMVILWLLRDTYILGFGIASAIWIPYFRMSKRVKATFIN